MDLYKLIMCIHVSINHIGKTTVVRGQLLKGDRGSLKRIKRCTTTLLSQSVL